MPMTKTPLATVKIPRFNGQNTEANIDDLELKIHAGEIFVFMGANGSGKTRLGVFLEKKIDPPATFPFNQQTSYNPNSPKCYRIAAQRSVIVPEKINRSSNSVEAKKTLFLVHGKSTLSPSLILQNDFEKALDILFLDTMNDSYEYHQEAKLNPENIKSPKHTILDKALGLWTKINPHRELNFDNKMWALQTINPDKNETYEARELSDGERSIFYYIAQALLAPENAVILLDEPELHLNRTILAQLWNEIEEMRPDCAFIYMTHDPDFAATRQNARKYAVSAYQKETNAEKWEIELVPEEIGFPEEILLKVIGSRQNILFVEGKKTSLDYALYKAAYPTWLAIPIEGCQTVIDTVKALNDCPSLHRVKIAGIIDNDGRSSKQIEALKEKNIHTLEVAEIENLFLLPEIFKILCRIKDHSEKEAESKLEDLKEKIKKLIQTKKEEYVFDYNKRALLQQLQDIISPEDKDKSLKQFQEKIKKNNPFINPIQHGQDRLKEIETALETNDYKTLLFLCDDKGFLGQATSILGEKDYTDWLPRILRNASGEHHLALREALKKVLPSETELLANQAKTKI
ncbi:DUF4435 domain-containing protein [Acetobacteraceae bacterium]|nr:DUF4435 domain-containing protein [Acetobacteraceae bacterium]